MGTEKRERQKANRQQRLIEEQRAARVDAVRRNAVRWGVAIVLAIAGVVAIAWVGGAFDGEEADEEVPAVERSTKPEVVVPDEIPTELQVNTLVEGDGPEAAVGDEITVDYVGVRTEDGTEFDNSYDRGQPFTLTLGAGGVIQGWDQGLVGARAGERLQLDIPADLAYGDNPPGDVIQPGDALTFVIDVVAVSAAATE